MQRIERGRRHMDNQPAVQNNPVPVIDLAPFLNGHDAARQPVVDQARRACEQIGFLTITGHGVSPELIERTAAAARAFFDLPESEKKHMRMTAAGAGYSPVQGERLAATRGSGTAQQRAPAD